MKKYVLGPDAARKLKALFNESGGVSRRLTGSSALVSELEYEAPFKVQWAQSANEGAGAWIVWLPDPSILTIHGVSVDAASNLEAVGGEYPEGWYVLDCVDADVGGRLLLSPSGVFSVEDENNLADGKFVIADCIVDQETGARDVVQFVKSAIVSGGNPKPFDITVEVDEDGNQHRVMKRCVVQKTSGTGATDIGDWGDFPEIGPEQTCMIWLKVVKPRKEDVEDIPSDEYSIEAKVFDPGEEMEDEDETDGLVHRYALYKLGYGYEVVVDYREAYIRPLSWYSDERSISQDDYPNYRSVLSLSHFYDDVRDITAIRAKALEKCDIVVRAVLQSGEAEKVCYVPLDDLIRSIPSGGGGGGGGDDPDDPPDDPPVNPPQGGITLADVEEWVKTHVVTSLNGEKGDLVLRLIEGWLEIVKDGEAKKAVGTVTTSVSGLIGDMAVIGGNKIIVEQEGNSLRISFADDKESNDLNPFPPSPDVCSHPDGGGGVLGGGGGGGGVAGGAGESGGGDSCCGGSSTTGGTATGSPAAGASGKPATGVPGAANGKEVTEPPSGGVSSGGKEAGGGLFNGSTIPKKRIEDTNTHGTLTDSKKMNKSPFANDPNWHGSIEETQGNTKRPIYSGTHNQLTDSKRMNESPFKRK